MMDRVTFHVRDGIAVTGVGKIYDPAKRKTRTIAGAVIRLSEYEDTGLDPLEIRRLKAERDAAVRDLEEAMFLGVKSVDLCRYCSTDNCYNRRGSQLCHPKWRGPQQEET